MSKTDDELIFEGLCDAICADVLKEYFKNLRMLYDAQNAVDASERYLRSSDFERFGYDADFLINRVRELSKDSSIGVKYGTI